MVSLPALQTKPLAVLLMESFKKRLNMCVMGAAQEAASITGFNEKTVKLYHKEFFENEGHFKETRQGKYRRNCLLKDENLRLEAAMGVREHACKKGEANMTAKSFSQWVNEELLPLHNLPANLPQSISVRTATRWLHPLGYFPLFHKRGAYVDGHEREDVVKCRDKFLKELEDL